MTRGEVAEKAGVNPEPLRYYEREELIPVPPRSDGSFRFYDDSYVDRLRFIQRAQDLGFALAEVKSLLRLRTGEEATCRDVKEKALAKIEDVDEKIRDLERIREALRLLTEACAGREGPTGECPILNALEGEGALGRGRSEPSEARLLLFPASLGAQTLLGRHETIVFARQTRLLIYAHVDDTLGVSLVDRFFPDRRAAARCRRGSLGASSGCSGASSARDGSAARR